jgi:hypothetical protein
VPQFLSHPKVRRALAGCDHTPSDEQYTTHNGRVRQLQDTGNTPISCGQGHDDTSTGAWGFPGAEGTSVARGHVHAWRRFVLPEVMCMHGAQKLSLSHEIESIAHKEEYKQHKARLQSLLFC